MRKIALALFLAIFAPALRGQNPNAAKFPGSLATDSDLLVAVNRSSSKLTANIDSTTLAIPVQNSAPFRTGQVVTIDNEHVQICSIAGNTLSACSRGFGGTVPAPHNAGAAVEGRLIAWHHNQLAAEVKAIQQSLNVTSPCSILFASASRVFGGAQDFCWDNSGQRLGLGTTAPSAAKFHVEANFSGQASGYAGQRFTFTWPTPRGTNLYHGLRIDIADSLVDGSSGIGIYNTGEGDGIFIEARGASSGTTVPTGIGVNMNHINGTQNNPSYAGYGIQIWDYSQNQNSGAPLVVSNKAGGSNKLAVFNNDGNGPAYVWFKAGNTAENESGILWLNRSWGAVFQMRKNGADQWQLINAAQGKVVLQADNVADTRAVAPQGIQLGSFTQATLPAAPNGTLVYCSDCTVNSAPCSGGSTGAVAKRVNGSWRCD